MRLPITPVLAVALLAVPPAATAHAVLVKSQPAARAALGRPPERVQLWFSERLEPAYSSVSVWDAAGGRVDAGNGAVSAEDPRRLDVSLPALGAGRYLVRFRVLSVDGHVVDASLPFTIKAGPGR